MSLPQVPSDPYVPNVKSLSPLYQPCSIARSLTIGTLARNFFQANQIRQNHPTFPQSHAHTRPNWASHRCQDCLTLPTARQEEKTFAFSVASSEVACSTPDNKNINIEIGFF